MPIVLCTVKFIFFCENMEYKNFKYALEKEATSA